MLSCPQGNCGWQEVKNWYRGRLIIKPQTFCDLKEIELKTIKIQQKKKQPCVINMQSRIPLLPNKPLIGIN